MEDFKRKKFQTFSSKSGLGRREWLPNLPCQGVMIITNKNARLFTIALLLTITISAKTNPEFDSEVLDILDDRSLRGGRSLELVATGGSTVFTCSSTIC